MQDHTPVVNLQRRSRSIGFVTDPNDVNELHWAAYVRRLRTKPASPLTIRSYRQAFDDLLVHHPGRDISDLQHADVQDYLLASLDRLKTTTVAIRFRSLRAFYNWCVKEGIIDQSPMAKMVEPKGTDEPPAVLDDEDLKTLLAACDGKTFEDRRDTAIIRLFCEPGSPRVAEMADILLHDLDMRKDLVRLTGKGNKVRTIPFGAKTGQALDRYLRARAKHKKHGLPQLWLGGRGGAFTHWGIRQMLARRAEEAGIGHVHPHQLRHTAAHVWMDNDGSEGDAQELFGWSSSEMPRRYGRSARTARAHRTARRKSLGDRL
jgi:integrase/recombinase XerD